MEAITKLQLIVPTEFTEKILEGIKVEIDKLKADFQPKEPTVYLTRNEVRDLLKVDLSTVHNWTKRGKLRAYGIGNRVYYRRDEVEAAIKPLKV